MSEDCPYCVFEKTEANCRGCFEGSHYKPKPITNADRIRAMTDEELAEFINGVEAEAIRRAGLFITVGDIQRGKEGWLGWLKEEADG